MKFAVVRNDSKKDGCFMYFAGWMHAEWDELPSTMTWRWMPLHIVWDMAMSRDQNLAISSAEVIKALCPSRQGKKPMSGLRRKVELQPLGGRNKKPARRRWEERERRDWPDREDQRGHREEGRGIGRIGQGSIGVR